MFRRDESRAWAVARPTLHRTSIALAIGFGLLLAAGSAGAQDGIQLVPEKVSYDVGEQVRLKVVYPDPGKTPPAHPGAQLSVEIPADLAVTLRYAGASKSILEDVPLAESFVASKSNYSTKYREVWRIPEDAETGRYEVDLRIRDPKTHEIISSRENAASFAVHRKLVRIKRIELDKAFYTSGDPVQCRATIENLSDKPLSGLLVEFSERHWPWIAPPANTPPPATVSLAEGLSLAAHAEVDVRTGTPLVGKEVKQPAVQQYAVIVWDREHKNVYDIAFSSLAFIHPPGVDTPRPYPLQYAYPDLRSVDTTNYRDFEPPAQNSAAIQFNHEHTMYRIGEQATVQLSVRNPTDTPWPGVSVHASLRSLGSAGLGEKTVAEKVDLEPRAAALEKEVTFALPSDKGGVFRVVIQVMGASGEILAENNLEIASNSLPKSILIFCAHEDDEGSLSGVIRAAVEGRIPLEIVYFTSGDAGSCDRYYERSCGPAEALNYGGLRMEETRASLAHLGVSGEHIHFLGLPDGGSGEIWYRHKDAAAPYLAVLLASDHAPYEGLVRPNLPYARQPVIEVVKDLIRKFHAESVFAAHPPQQGHIDHIVNGYFVIKALQELAREDPAWGDTKVFAGRVYDAASAPQTPYHYQEYVVHVPGEVAARAQEAGWFYQSQGGNRALGRIRRFSQLGRIEILRQVLDWKEHEGWNEKN
jgi:LmbE family N-acetylglucosaminyl deacetylase